MRASAAIVFVLACSKSSDNKTDRAPPARPASATDAMVATAERYVDLMAKLGDDIAAAGSDCKKAVAALRARGAEAETFRADIEKLVTLANDAAAAAWFDATYMPRMRAAGEHFRPTVDACNDDREFGAAMEANLLVPRRKRAAK